MKTKQPDMSKHSSCAKYAQTFPWRKILNSEEIALIPALTAIDGYDARQGVWYPRESREGLINFVIANPEFDLVSQPDDGNDCYGLIVFNSYWYKIGLRLIKDRKKWLGEKS